ncbi:MAG TPA: diacylglycerol kinase family protein [Candidatus Dormibacteraeota bacterium]|nr:diacylglycerol kinase family protein [Candidatus Dormibacteraeota bacterium]
MNPGAGRRRAGAVAFQKVWDEIRGTLEAAGFRLRVEETAVPHPTASALAETARRDGYEAVLVAGGDGTVAEVARTLVNSDVVLGILPFGSVMNVAHSIPLPLDPLDATRVIARKRIRRIDVGDVGGQYFLEAAGVGLDADAFGAARSVERGDVRTALRRMRDALARESHWIDVSIDGAKPVRYRALQILVTNGRYYAFSLPVVPDADIADGMLDVAIFRRMGRLGLLRHLASLALRWRPPTRPDVHRGREIRIDCVEPLRVHADNIIAGTLPQTFRCRPEALAIFA